MLGNCSTVSHEIGVIHSAVAVEVGVAARRAELELHG
jgi:hypothetical protein